MKTIMPGKEISESLSKALLAKIAALPIGAVLAVHMRNVQTDDNKVQVEFAEKINLSTQPRSALAMFNPGDDRFSQGARRCWLTMDRKYAEQMFGVSIKDGEAFAEIGTELKPVDTGQTDAAGNKVLSDLRVRIIEKKESQLTEAQQEYRENYIKTIPSTGAFFYAHDDNQRVASTTDLVVLPRVWNADKNQYVKAEVPHTLIPGEYRTTSAKSVLTGAGALAGAATKVDPNFVP